MVQIQLINSVIKHKKRLECEEKRQENHRSEPYVNYLAAPQPYRNGHKQCETSQEHTDFIKAPNSYAPGL